MFGARPSGSKILEEAIDHMIDLALENGLSGVTTEDVNVSSLQTRTKGFLEPICIIIIFNYRYHIGFEGKNQL